MRNLSRFVAILTVTVLTGCPPGPKEPTEDDGAGETIGDKADPAKDDTGETGDSAASTCQDELDAATAAAASWKAKFDACEAGAN